MFRAFLFCLAISLPLTSMVACGKSTKEKVEDSNSKINRMNDIQKELEGKLVFFADSSTEAKTIQALSEAVINHGLKNDDRKHVIDLLNEYVNDANTVLDTLNSSSNIIGDRSKLESRRDQARSLLSTAQAAQAKSQS